MLTIRHSSKTKYANVVTITRCSRRIVATLILSSVVILGVSGCGQKGALYLVDSSSQTVQSSTAALDSTSNPQDAAFAGISNDSAQQTSNIELPEPSTDPNDY